MTHQWDGGRGPTLCYEAFVVPACWTFTDRRNKSASDERSSSGFNQPEHADFNYVNVSAGCFFSHQVCEATRCHCITAKQNDNFTLILMSH